MSDENVLDGYTIGFDPAHGEDRPCLQILRDPGAMNGKREVVHTSFSWETTAAHLAAALAEVEKLRPLAKEMQAIKEFCDAVGDRCTLPKGLATEVVRLRGLVGELLKEYTQWKPGMGILAPQKPSHGPCCTCQVCGHDHDTCVCEHNTIQALLDAACYSTPELAEAANDTPAGVGRESQAAPSSPEARPGPDIDARE